MYVSRLYRYLGTGIRQSEKITALKVQSWGGCGRTLKPGQKQLVFGKWLGGVREITLIRGSHRHFSTSGPRKALPNIVILIATRFAKVGGALLGRRTRNWWKKLSVDEKGEYLRKMKRYRMWAYGSLLGICSGFGGFYYTHIEEAPYTGRKRFIAFSPEKYELLGKEAFESEVATYSEKILDAKSSSPLYSLVASVVYRLINANSEDALVKGKKWTLTLVQDDSMIEAFVTPSGNIFIFTGMLRLCEDKDDLAIVIGHEMAHVLIGHSAEKISNAGFMDLVMIIPMAALWALIPTDLSAIFCSLISGTLHKLAMDLPYSRMLEEEADSVGLTLAAKACYDIRKAPTLWEKIDYVSATDGIDDKLSLALEWVSTHPNNN